MTTPVAGYASITALAAALNMPLPRVWKRIAALKAKGFEVTYDNVRRNPTRGFGKRTQGIAVTLEDGTVCASIAEAALRINSSPGRVSRLVALGLPVVPWEPRGVLRDAPKGSAYAHRYCALLIERCELVRRNRRAA